MDKEKHLKYFTNVLVIDPQEDCECSVEIYDAGDSVKCVWLQDDIPKIVDCYDRINLPMSLNPISFEQFKQCLLTSLAFASPIKSTQDIFSASRILINEDFKFEELPIEYFRALEHLMPRRNNTVICLSEIPRNHIYFIPDPEFLGVFTWNISRYGMFIMAEKIKSYAT